MSLGKSVSFVDLPYRSNVWIASVRCFNQTIYTVHDSILALLNFCNLIT